MKYEADEVLPNLIDEAGDAVIKRLARPIYYPYFIYRFSWLHTKFRKVFTFFYKDLNHIVNSAIQKRLKILEAEKNQEQRIFIDELLKMKKDGQTLEYEGLQETMLCLLTAVSCYPILKTLENH